MHTTLNGKEEDTVRIVLPTGETLHMDYVFSVEVDHGTLRVTTTTKQIFFAAGHWSFVEVK